MLGNNISNDIITYVARSVFQNSYELIFKFRKCPGSMSLKCNIRVDKDFIP